MKENIEPTRLFRKVKALREENKTLKEELTYFKEQNQLLRTRCREVTLENHNLTLKVKDLEFTRKYLTSEEAGKQFAQDLLGGK